PALDAPFALDSAALSCIAADRSPALEAAGQVLGQLEISGSAEDRRALAAIARATVERSARLVAAALAGALSYGDPALRHPPRMAVAGSSYGGYPGYEGRVPRALAALLGAERAGRIALEFAKDSTGLGAAVVAAVAARRG